jgi:hypothetical protein
MIHHLIHLACENLRHHALASFPHKGRATYHVGNGASVRSRGILCVSQLKRRSHALYPYGGSDHDNVLPRENEGLCSCTLYNAKRGYGQLILFAQNRAIVTTVDCSEFLALVSDMTCSVLGR